MLDKNAYFQSVLQSLADQYSCEEEICDCSGGFTEAMVVIMQILISPSLMGKISDICLEESFLLNHSYSCQVTLLFVYVLFKCINYITILNT